MCLIDDRSDKDDVYAQAEAPHGRGRPARVACSVTAKIVCSTKGAFKPSCRSILLQFQDDFDDFAVGAYADRQLKISRASRNDRLCFTEGGLSVKEIFSVEQPGEIGRGEKLPFVSMPT